MSLLAENRFPILYLTDPPVSRVLFSVFAPSGINFWLDFDQISCKACSLLVVIESSYDDDDDDGQGRIA
jgi:hypothetical protein